MLGLSHYFQNVGNHPKYMSPLFLMVAVMHLNQRQVRQRRVTPTDGIHASFLFLLVAFNAPKPKEEAIGDDGQRWDTCRQLAFRIRATRCAYGNKIDLRLLFGGEKDVTMPESCFVVFVIVMCRRNVRKDF